MAGLTLSHRIRIRHGESATDHFSVNGTAPSMWWRMDILMLMRHWSPDRSFPERPPSATLWDGRDENGQIVANETYTARLTPLDENRNDGHACHVSFVVDNPLQQ